MVAVTVNPTPPISTSYLFCLESSLHCAPILLYRPSKNSVLYFKKHSKNPHNTPELEQPKNKHHSSTIMAFRSLNYWRSMAKKIRCGGAATYATSTPPKMKAYAPTADFGHQPPKRKLRLKAEHIPLLAGIGGITLSVSLGLITAKHQVLHSPNVRLRKKDRETIPELVDPDKVVNEADRFVNKSLFRKVGHLHEFDNDLGNMHHTVHDVYVHDHHVETLKDVGVDSKQLT